MKSAVITSGEHWLTIDGIEYLRGTIENIQPITYSDGKKAVRISGSSVNAYVILVDGTTIDGVEVNTPEELLNFIKENSFKEGGSTGNSGVQSIRAGDNVMVNNDDPKNPIISATGGGGTGIPTLSPRNVIIGGSNGNELRLIRPSDVTTSQGSGANRLLTFNGTTNAFTGSTAFSNNQDGNTIAQRTAGGQIRVANASNDLDALNLGQYKSMTVENDILTDEQNEESLNSIYPTAAPGFILIAPNVGSGMAYFKTNAGWFALPGFKVMS